MKELQNALSKININIYGVTDNLNNIGDRVDEIFEWLTKKNIDNIKWIAIDDYDLIKMNPKITFKNFVKTSNKNGLTVALVCEAIKKLNSQ